MSYIPLDGKWKCRLRWYGALALCFGLKFIKPIYCYDIGLQREG